MTYAYTYDVPIDEGLYRKIREGLGPEVPAGLLSHVAIQLPEGGLRYIDVWRSQGDHEQFVEHRLHAVVHPLLESTLGFVPPEPEHHALDVIHVWSNSANCP